MMKISKNIVWLILILFLLNKSNAQTDRTFWFVAPDITSSNCLGGTCPGGEPVYLQIVSLNLEAVVTISIPANGAFTPIILEMEANTSSRVDLSAFIVLGQIENEPSNSILNKGILIESTQLINVYYDEDENYNTDIFVLKGGNALGIDFYTPFQNIWGNGTYAPNARSAIDIVATQNGTSVTITPTVAVDGHAAGVPFVVNLGRGQTYSCRAVGANAIDHLGGTHITSNFPIAVTISDDSVFANGEGGCVDEVGDQLIPVNVIGYEYIVMRGQLYDMPPDITRDVHESAYILATQNGTDIFIDGNPVAVTTINTGQTYRYELSAAKNGTHIRGSEPVYVWHVSGFGCEMGGAILPTIDGCNGNYEVSLRRPTSQGFFLNLFITDGPEKFSFWLEYENGTTYNIPSTWFESVGATGWVVLKDVNKQFADGIAGGIPSGEVTRIYNTEFVFHVGMMSGLSTSGCKYGYLSNFAVDSGVGEIADVHLATDQICHGDTLELLATGGINYFWETVPAGETWISYLSDRNIPNPKVFLPSGTFDYVVSVIRPCLGDTNIDISIVIHPEIEALFSVDQSIGCAPFPVTITDESIGADGTYQWVFGDLTPDNLTNFPPPHIYANATDTIQDYELMLVAINAQNCPDTLRQNMKISPFITANFNQNAVTGCNPLGIQFENNTTGGTLDAAIYEWTFGDSGSSYDSIPYHEYQNVLAIDTVYTTSLVVKSEFNCTDTLTRNFTVHSYISAEFDVDTVIGCSPFTVDIAAVTYPGIGGYEWDFGDGSPLVFVADPGPHIYTNVTGITDTLELRLVVDNVDCTDTLIREIIVYSGVTADFTPDDATVCNPTIVNFTNNSQAWAVDYNWNFGDGGSSGESGAVVSHLYENLGTVDSLYSAILEVTTSEGCSDADTNIITVYPFIDADYTIEDAIGCAPFEVTTNNQSDYAGITEWRWDFGDGSPIYSSVIFEPIVTHTYQNVTGAIVVRDLELVVDNGNCTDTLIRQITIYPEVTASFNVNTAAGCHPLEVEFTNTSLVTAPATYEWDFNDGVYSTDVDPVHSFSNFSIIDISRTVQLITLSDYDCSDTITQNIDIYHNAKAEFSINKTFDCPPLDVVLTNTSDGADSYEWDFGDVGSSFLVNPTYSYDNLTPIVITNNLQLFAKTVNDCNDTTGLMVSVFPRVTAGFAYDNAGCSPFEVDFTNTSANADTYFWDFDDGVTSGAEEPLNQFINSSSVNMNFTVELIASSSYDCKDSIEQIVTSYPSPNVEFFVNPIHQVYYDPAAVVQLENKTSYQTTWNYEWNFGDETSSTTGVDEFDHPYSAWGDMEDEFGYVISLRAYSINCEDSVSHTIFVVPPLPELEITIPPQGGCAPLTVDFTVTSNYADTYYWDFDDGTTSTEMEPQHVFETDGVFNVEFRGDGDGGSSSVFIEVIVDKTPIVDFIYSPTLYYYLGEDTLTCVSKSEYGELYWWDFGDNSIEVEGERVEYRYTEVGYYYITLRVVSENGCESSLTTPDSIIVSNRGNLKLPNAFTPSANNGTNLTFKPIQEETEGVKEFHMYIYNRWGELLFVTDDVEVGWDGMYKGKLANQDVYIWKVEVRFTNGTAREFAGDLTLLR